MTRKIYKSAMGKSVDLGALLLQNEEVRAVGNMNVNSRGDILDGTNRVIDQKNRQTQRQYQRTVTNVSAEAPVQASTRSAKKASGQPLVNSAIDSVDPLSTFDMSVNTCVEEPLVAPIPVPQENISPGGGLAAAIARSRTIKQEKEKTLSERQQSQGLKKI